MQLSHVFASFGNYTVSFDIWNEAGSFSKEYIQVVEPVLAQVVEFTTSEHSLPVPLNVTFYIIDLEPVPHFPIWMQCDFYPESGTIETNYIQLEGQFTFDHSYVTDVPSVDVTIHCENHISSIDFTERIILQEDFSGLQIIVNTDETLETGRNTSLEITMTTGSHAELTVDFTDGSDPVFLTNDVIYSSQLTWNVSHLFDNPQNFTVQMTARNNFYAATTLLKTINFNEELVLSASEVLFDETVHPARNGERFEWACRQMSEV